MGMLQLTEIQAQENAFSGEIPDEFWNNVGLIILRLDNNNFSGSISESIGDLKDLTDLRVANNTFTGDLPVTLWSLTGIGKLENAYLFLRSRFIYRASY